MAAPVNPNSNYVPHTTAVADQVDASFAPLYNALDKTKVGLDAASIQDGMLALGLLVQEAWQSVALVGATWTPATLEFRKDPLGVVRMRGVPHSISANIGAGVTLTTLPVGYRPGAQIAIPVSFPQTGASGDFPVIVNTDGTIVTWPTSGQLVATQGPFAFQGAFWAEG